MIGFKKKTKDKKTKSKAKNITKFIGEPGFTYPYGYVETDPYLFLGKRTVVSIFDVVFQYGTNRPAAIGWLTRLIPSELLEDGRVTFVQRQKGVDKSTEDNITSKQLESNAATMSNNDSSDTKENSKNNDRIEDLQIAASLAKKDIIVDSDVKLIVKAKSPKAVERVIHELKLIYKDKGIHGVMLVRRIGQQLENLKSMYVDVEGDAYHNSDMSSVAAGRLFLPSAGFSDTHGVSVGIDVHSLISRNPAVIDFGQVRNAVIYMGEVEPFVSIGGYEGGDFMQSGGTAVAHVLADGNYLSGQRTHHIVLSQNDYHTSDSLVFDMSKESINPFEVFGEPETVVQDANANFDKANTMMLMAAGAEDNEYIKNNLKRELINWYIYRAKGNGIYSKDPKHEPVKARRILADDDHESYPTPADFLMSLRSMMSESAKISADELRDSRLMYNTMSTLTSSYPNIFNTHTTLPNVLKAKDRNIYYDLSNLGEDPKITKIEFLNVLAYVTHRALPGEMIVIDGIDEIDLPVNALMPYRKRMKRKGINLITVFEHNNRPVNPISYEPFTGALSQQDMVVLGRITPDDAESFSKSWQQDLPATVEQQLEVGNRGILYFYRTADHIGALVDTHLIL